MAKVSIYGIKPTRKKGGVYKERQVIRIVNTTPSFNGIGPKGNIIHHEFKNLVDSLEPHNDGFSVV